MNTDCYFEIPVKSITRAAKFYEGILDLKLEVERSSNNVLAKFVDNAGCTYGCLFEDEAFIPDMFGIIITFYNKKKKVSDLSLRVAQLGGKVLHQNKLMNLTGGYRALIQDSEGNRIGLYNGLAEKNG